MTEEFVRAVFLKNYSGGDLNEALMASMEEIMLAVIRKDSEQPESLPKIIGKIAMAKSRTALFGRMTVGTSSVVPDMYLTYFDQARKETADIVRYTRDNYETMDQWFKGRLTKEALNSILADIAFVIEESARKPAHKRTFHSSELKLYEEFFNYALVGVIGKERFNKYAKEYNESMAILRKCQTESLALGREVVTKES